MYIGHVIKQKPYEKIEYLLHRHPFTFIPMVLLFLILMAAPFGLYSLLTNLYPDLFNNEIYFVLGVLFASVYYLSIFLFAYGEFVDFYLDMWIVTNDRIVDVEQEGLFSRTTSELDLYRVQDVTVDIRGIFHTLLNYGNLTIKTASGNNDLIFHNISDPNDVRRAVIELSEHDRKFHHDGG
jgi:uncharacterized membrane protein YdbT with pleckstrin-like domain